MPIKPQVSRTNQADAGFDDGPLGVVDIPAFGMINPAQAFAGGLVAQSAAPTAPTAPPSFDSFSFVSAAVVVSNTPAIVAAASGTSTASVTASKTVAVSLPSWISSLSTASIAADMAAADVNGTVSYAGLNKVFSDLDALLASTKTKLTAAEFNDLKTISANLNNGMSTSSYLCSVTGSLVNGSAANATWTGGNATSVALGNLASGATATQLSELIGKWFSGTDLPSSKVSMGGSNFSVSYSTSSSPLFASSGPSMNDINQGYLGDCYLLASLAEVAKENSSIISSMFTSNGNNTYGVKFYVNGVAQYVTVNSSLANGGNIFNSGADIWASLAEKGYAQLQASGVVTGNSINYGNSWSTIGNGGAPEMALEEITGASAITDFYGSGSSWAKVTYNSSLGMTNYTTGNATASVLATLVADLSIGDDVILSSWTNGKDSAGKTTLVASHAMSIYGYDSATGMLQVRNPWGSESGQYWDTTFEVSLATLLAAGDTITVDNVGKGTSPTHTAPTVSSQTAAQTWKLGQAVNFKLAANTFTDPQGSALTYAATLSNGAALPSWLAFNAATGTFTGAVPLNAAGMTIKVIATDTYGLSASETFAVTTPVASAPTVSAQTASQSWKTGQAVNLALASNTFTDPQGETLIYTATQANGAALPAWLKFNGATDTFTGTAPSAATTLSLKVTATNSGGVSNSETFGVSIAAKVSSFVEAIASLSDGGAASAFFTQVAATNPQTLASPFGGARG
jgi:hypothetical protein